MVVSYAVNMNMQFMAPKTFGAFEVGDSPPTGKRDDERLNFIFPTFWMQFIDPNKGEFPEVDEAKTDEES